MSDPRKLALLALTPREEAVVDLVRQGLSNADIARQHSIAPRTVTSHLQNIFNKVGCSSRTEMLYMLESNLSAELQTRLDVANQSNSDLTNRVAELQTQLTLYQKLYDQLLHVSVHPPGS